MVGYKAVGVFRRPQKESERVKERPSESLRQINFASAAVLWLEENDVADRRKRPESVPCSLHWQRLAAWYQK
ncbi:hypothetical protein BWD08_05540 [Neisseria animaloris]|nr:hypothetical protein BWD08_05540 [Neisseria animaloris]